MIIRFTAQHRPYQMDVLPKTFVLITLTAKWLVRPATNSDGVWILLCIYPSFMLATAEYSTLQV